ncbi:dynein axonemal heavy chain 5 isoform X2 [Argonauta hians]
MGPLSELKKWRRKYEILETIIGQLKNRECKSVISCLIAGRSKILRKWKLIDSRLSEAINESRDKVKYLEFIKSHLLELQNTCCPEFVMHTIIPDIITALIKQDSLSRHFARSGFLTILLKKICNQLAAVFNKYIKMCTKNPEGDDTFGKHILQSCYIIINQQQKNTDKDKVQEKKTIEKCLYKQLKICIQAANFLRDSISILYSSIFNYYGKSLASRSTSYIFQQVSANFKLKTVSSINSSDFCHTKKGIPFNEEAIFVNLDPLIHHIKQVIYIMETFSQFSLLKMSSVNLPLLKYEDIDFDEMTDDKITDEDGNSDVFRPGYDLNSNNLHEIKNNALQEEKQDVSKSRRKIISFDGIKGNKLNDQILKVYFATDEENCLILSNIFGKTVESLVTIMQRINSDILEIELDESGKFDSLFCEFKFDSIFCEFQSVISENELLIESYLDVIFKKYISVKQSLDILKRFSSVSKRTELAAKIGKCYIKVFNDYTADFEEHWDVFKSNKDNPPISRNSPKLAGTIQWCRFTLKKIKYPMDILMDIPDVLQLPHFSRFAKTYDDAVITIKEFQRKTIDGWMKSLASAVHGFNSSLFTHHIGSKELLINIDPRLLVVIEETKLMVKMGVPVSKNVKAILLQENKLKNYKMHLELCFQEFEKTKAICPRIWQQLFKEHYSQMSREFQPGLNCLSWNSFNIDAFLCQIKCAEHKLRDLTYDVQEIICQQVDKIIEQIEELLLFSVNDQSLRYQQYEEVQKTMVESVDDQIVIMNKHIHNLKKAIQDILGLVAIKQNPKGITNTSTGYNPEYNESFEKDKTQLSAKVIDNENFERIYIQSFNKFDFLWSRNYQKRFLSTHPNTMKIESKIEEFIEMEEELARIPAVVEIGLLSIKTDPVRQSLQSYLLSWKTLYASVLLKDAHDMLESACDKRKQLFTILGFPNETLGQLNDVLNALQQIRDMQNKIDQIYSPIEMAYSKLVNYGVPIPRSEMKEVEELQSSWNKITEIAEATEKYIFSDKRLTIVQKIQQENMELVVKVIHFRNAFDDVDRNSSESSPDEAVERLNKIQKECINLKKQRDILENMARIFVVTINKFTELDQTEEELRLVDCLYKIYVQFIQFDKQFQNSLWCDINFRTTVNRVELFWDDYLLLPERLQCYSVYHKLKNGIATYQETIPVLNILHSKTIQNRHWLKVMTVTQSTFPTDVNILKVLHLFNLGLHSYKSDIIEIYQVSLKEMELETTVANIEEEWSKKELIFHKYKKLGSVTLDLEFTEKMLEQLEDSQTAFTNMLASPYISPIQEHVANWTEKFKELSVLLELWIDVQNLWMYLESIFSNSSSIKICCGEIHLKSELLDIQKDLESCSKSLGNYLENKRRLFPRFFFLSNSVLLATLSKPNSLQSIKHSLRSLFGYISEIDTECERNEEMKPTGTAEMKMVAVKSFEGEKLVLDKMVPVYHAVEWWLNQLKLSISDTIANLSVNAIQEITETTNLEEFLSKYPTQICQLSVLYLWTSEVEKGILDLNQERKALIKVYKKYCCTHNKFLSSFNRFSSKSTSDTKSRYVRVRCEKVMTQTLYLRDTLNRLCKRKVKHCTDFDWRRYFKCYMIPANKLKPHLEILDHKLVYGGEFCGSNPSIIMTPVTDKCFLSICLALQNLKPVYLLGMPGTGKTEIMKGLANSVAQFHYVLHCFPQFDASCLQRIIQGSSMEGCWLCLAEGNKLSHKSSDVVMDQVSLILDSIRNNSLVVKDIYRKLTFEVNPRTYFFLTSTFHEELNWDFARKIKSVFRSVSLLKPNTYGILKGYFLSAGFKNANILAARLLEVISLADLQLQPECQTTSFSLSSMITTIKRAQQIRKTIEEKSKEKADTVLSESPVSTSNSKVTSSNISRQCEMKVRPQTCTKDLEMSVLFQSLEEIFCPAMDSNVFLRFQELLSTCIRRNSPGTLKTSKDKYEDLKNTISEKANQKQLMANEEWIAKCLQLNFLSQNFPGVLMVGSPGSGKTTCLETLVEAYNNCHNMTNISNIDTKLLESNAHKLIKVNPVSFESSETIFGWMDLDSHFIDGFLMHTVKKARKNNFKTWFLIDSPLNDEWLDQLSTLFNNKQIQLKNGDIVPMNGNLKTFIETDSIESASPMTVTKLGMVYFNGLVRWDVLVKAWMKEGNHTSVQIKGFHTEYDIREASTMLMQCYQSCMDPVIQFFKTERNSKLYLNEVSLTTASLQILTVLLSNCQLVSSETHIKRFFVFSLIWSVGGSLSSNDRLHFNEFLLKLTSDLIPEDGNDVNLFDYYVGDSGEWENWNMKTFEESSVLQNEYVHSLRTIPIKYFLSNFVQNGFPFLLSGPRGCGKTSLINSFMTSLDSDEFILKRFVSSGSSTTTQLYNLFSSCIIQRKGLSNGEEDKKNLIIHIEDIYIPKRNQFHTRKRNEFLRQVLEEKVIREPSSPFEMKIIAGLCLIAEMEQPEPYLEQMNRRLLRHFTIFHLSEPDENDITAILWRKLEAAVNREDTPSIETKLLNNLIEASSQLLSGLQSTLKVSSLPGSTHYIFNIQSLEHCFKMLSQIPLKERTNDSFITLLWIHGIKTILLDSVCRNEDRNFFKQLLNTIVSKVWPNMVNASSIGYFISIPLMNSKLTNDALYHTECLSSLEDTIRRHIDLYNSDHPMKPLNITPSEYGISQITKVHRVLKCSDRSHLVSVSSVFSDIVDIYKLTCHMTNTKAIQMEYFSRNDLPQLLKTAVKEAGIENVPVAFILQDKDLQHPADLEWINSFLVTEDYTTHYSTDELNILLQSVELQLKNNHLERTIKPANYFCSNVKKNFHILIHLTPSNSSLSNAYREYPGILKSCPINWLQEWSEESLISMSTCYLHESKVFQNKDVRNQIIKCLIKIHQFIFKEYNKAPWTGNQASNIEISQTESPDTEKVFNENVSNLPYTQTLLLDHTRLKEETSSSVPNQESFISTNSYKQLFNCFQYLINMKSKEQQEKTARISKALIKLRDTKEKLQQITEDVDLKTKEYNNAKLKFEEYLEKIIDKAVQIETLKFQTGQKLEAKSIHDSYQFTNFLEQADKKDLSEDDAYDSYDEEFQRLMTENPEKQNKSEKELAKAKSQVKDKEKCVKLSKEKVYFWKSKISRNCIESIKGFTNPPNLVVQVINIVLIMTRKLNPLTYFNVSVEDPDTSSDHQKDTISLYLSPQEIQINLESIQEAVQSDICIGHTSKVLPGKGITVAEANHASKDVAILLQYVIALIVYSIFYKELQEMKENIKQLEEQIFLNNKHKATKDCEDEISNLPEDMLPDFNEDHITVLETEIESLQKPYREVVELKYSLEQQLQNKNNEIKAINILLNRLESKKLEWHSFTATESSETLFYNCIMAAAFLTYCPPFNIQTRERICCQFKDICSKHGFYQNSNQVFEDLSLDEFLFPGELGPQLETCLMEGLILFVTGIDPLKLLQNPQLLLVIFACKRFIQASQPFKMWLGEHEVECNPSFRLYLHTSNDISLMPDAFYPYLTIITLLQSYECLHKNLLLRCINQEKYQLKYERNHLLQEKWDKTKKAQETEHKLLIGLCEDIDLLGSIETVKELTELVNQHIETKERTNTQAIADQLTYLTNLNMIQFLRYKDRLVFTLFLAFEVDFMRGNILDKEREFVMNPLSPSTLHSSLEYIMAIKNPFEWMPDNIYRNLQSLALKFNWFTEIFVSLAKEGKDSSLKFLFDCQNPDRIICLPAKLNVLTPIQTLCVWRALRPNSVLLEALSYISTVLGNEFVANFVPNIPHIIGMTTPTEPILVFTEFQSGGVDVFFKNFLKGKKYEMISLHISNYSSSAEATLRKFLLKEMSQDKWIVLKNAHNWPSILIKITRWLLVKTAPNTAFRCCLTADVSYKDFPSQLLDNCYKIFIDSPMHAKDHLQWCSNQLNSDILDKNSTIQWPLVLYNSCLLYATLHHRTNIVHGWENTEDIENINTTDLNIIFGRYLQRTRDQICLKGMVESLISVNSLKKDFKFSKLKYSGLAPLYNRSKSLVNIQQELDKIPNQFLNSPFICHYPKDQQALPRNEEYLLRQLDKLLTMLPPKPMISSSSSSSSSSYSKHSYSISSDGTSSVTGIVTYQPEQHIENWRCSVEMSQLCTMMITKLPRMFSKEYLLCRMSKLGGATTYNKFILGEIFQLYKIINEVKISLQAIEDIFKGNTLGVRFTDEILEVAKDILHHKIPDYWNKLIGETAPPDTIEPTQWIQQLQNRSVFFEKIIHLGREKMPSYWLGAFFRPKMFLSIFRREFISKLCIENNDYETVTVITGRDKDHIREPPAEGVFIHDIYMWDFTWDRMAAQVVESLSKGSPSPLPVIHVYCSQKKRENIYSCPVYRSRVNVNKPLLSIDIYKENTPTTHWSLQAIMATLQPF